MTGEPGGTTPSAEHDPEQARDVVDRRGPKSGTSPEKGEGRGVQDGLSSTPPATSGADLARAALDAARARNAAARPRHHRRAGAADSAGGADSTARRMRRRRWSGPGVDKARDPQRIGDTVNTWLAATGAGRDVTKANLFARWAELVGTDIAAHATPVSLVDGELVVQAESTAWATQLRMLAPGMITKINAAVGRGTVIRIRTKGPTGPSWRFGNRHIPGRGPRDTYG